MKKKGFLILYFIIVITLFFLHIILFQEKVIPTANTVLINQLVKQTQDNWDELNKEVYPVSEYNFTVIDYNGRVLYSTEDKKYSSYEEGMNLAIKNYDIILDINIENKTVGKLFVHNTSNKSFHEKQIKLRKNAFFCFIVMALLMLLYYVYLDRKLLQPFHSLQKFASSIAAGNLDIPIKMDEKNIFGAYTESFDLMRDALQTSRQNEYMANKSKKELVASLSHDIKNPVASIQAICETMALDTEDERITTILQKAVQIDALISDMFQSTLDELGELKVLKEEHSSEVVLEIIEGINYYNSIQIISELPKCLIYTDLLRLTQVMENVAANSYKYAKTQLHISFEISDRFFIIKIKDFGPGVPENELPFICEKFYRGKNTDGKEGAGLGLYLSRLFMNKMGGQMECINSSDGFVVVLELLLVGNISCRK